MPRTTANSRLAVDLGRLLERRLSGGYLGDGKDVDWDAAVKQLATVVQNPAMQQAIATAARNAAKNAVSA